ncbi:MAG: T9SS type A sorting domain-containing protein [Bacteroidota bacterium]|nr:T9SS type A sorting domain-containing protein [Bacteroidota bacterium]
MSGNLTHEATLNGNGKIEMMGTTAQTIDMGSDSAYDLVINNTANTTLINSIVILDNLDFSNGKVILGSYNMNLVEAANVSNYSSSKYIVTDGTGSLIQNGIGTSGRTGSIDFPIGASTSSYNPATINNSGTKDNFSVKVYPTIYNSYSGGVGSGGSLSSTEEVDRTWIINEATNGGSNATLTLQWNASDEDASFSRNNCAIAYYDGTTWVRNINGAAATGSNPYTRSVSGVAEFANTPYGLGSNNSPLPVQFLDFDVVKQNFDAHITWSTALQYNTNNFEVERSFDMIHFETIGSLPALKNSSTNSYYTFDDKAILQYMIGNNLPYVYYRIKENDKDGKSQSTAVKSLNISSNATASMSMESVKVLPNPYSDNFAILYTMNSNMHIDFRLLDVNGKLIYTQSANALKGINQFDFKGFDHLASGLYMIEARMQNGEKQLYKIMKN